MATNIPQSASNSKSTAQGGSYHTKAHPQVGTGAGAALLGAIAGQTKAGPKTTDNAEYRKLYKVMHVGVGVPAIGNRPASENYGKYERLMEHAARLKVSESDIVWAALDMFLANPPEQLVARARGARGSSAGFWVIPVKDKDGRATGFRVLEVEARQDGAEEGITFLRYEPDNAKSRARARRGALNNAASNMELCGIKGTVKIDEFEDPTAAPVPAVADTGEIEDGDDEVDEIDGDDDDNDGQ